MKKIIEAIKAFFSPKAPVTTEVKKETIEEIYKVEPKIIEEAPKAPTKKKAKKKPAKKKTNESK
jgi:hypothetical protein